MSKVSKNIKMLDILSSGKIYNCTTLANLLEVSTRMVRQYKDELEKEGIYIKTIYGKNGGYQLVSNIELPSILFNGYDLETLNYIVPFIKDKVLLSRISNLKQKIEKYCRFVENDFSDLEDEKINILNIMKDSIINKKSVIIEYTSKGTLKQRKIFPIQIYKYDNLIMIIVQYSDDKTDIRHLNLNRINKIIN